MAIAGEGSQSEGSPPQSVIASVAAPAGGTGAAAGDELSSEELERRRAALAEIMELMREAVQQDGGDLVLAEVDYRGDRRRGAAGGLWVLRDFRDDPACGC